MASSYLHIFLLLITCLSVSPHSQATVPASATFRYVNEGEFGPYIVEYDGNYRTLPLFAAPFQLCFYNVTPNAYILALRMGLRRSESLFRWVWEANRSNPVSENATLTFGTDGNLVLADSDSRVAWQTGTANKGVTGLRLLSTGNIVLHDAAGRPVWQSFDHPTDTLMVGQSLRRNGSNKLVSRATESNHSEGSYSLVLEPSRLALYMKNPNSPRAPLLYYSSVGDLQLGNGSLASVTFASEPETEEGYSYLLTWDYTEALTSSTIGSFILARPKYNATLSILRIGLDGNLRIYTYNDKVDWGAWEETYTHFSRNRRREECGLPKRCGDFGLCEDNQCVACPSPKGLLGWTSGCAPPKPPACRSGKSSALNVGYYKVVGAEHFLNQYATEGEGPMKLVECRDKCTKDCKCVGFFYREESSKCLTVPLLDTLIKVSNSSHLAFIKVSK